MCCLTRYYEPGVAGRGWAMVAVGCQLGSQLGYPVTTRDRRSSAVGPSLALSDGYGPGERAYPPDGRVRCADLTWSWSRLTDIRGVEVCARRILMKSCVVRSAG